MFYDTRVFLSLIVSILFSVSAYSSETVEFDSTVISSIRYDRESQELTVFKVNEAEVVYGGVPEDVFNDFVEARLKGGYYRGFIEGEYEVISKAEGDPEISVPTPVSDAPVDSEAQKEDSLNQLSRADSTLSKIRTAVPAVDDARKKIAEAKALIEEGDLEESLSRIQSAHRDVRGFESRFVAEVNKAEEEAKLLEMKNADENALAISRVNEVINRLNPIVADLVRSSKSLKSAEDSLKKIK